MASKKAPKLKKRKLVVFDIDGTIFRSSLLIELVSALIQKKIFSPLVKKRYIRAYQNWLDRKDSYEKYIQSLVRVFNQNIRGVRIKDFFDVVKVIVDFYKNRVYCYTRDLIRKLKKQNYYLIAISHSPQVILKEFCRQWGFDKIYGRIYEWDRREKFTGKVLYLDVIENKAKVLRYLLKKENLTLNGSIGVGDTEIDIPFLKTVEKPICFNPNQKLYRFATKAGWKIVVERKDVIYHF